MSRRNSDSEDPPARPSGTDGRASGSDWVADSSLPVASHLTELPTVRPPSEGESPSSDDEVATDLPLPVPEPMEGAGLIADGDDRQRSMTIARKQMLRERRRMLAQGRLPEIIGYDRPRARSECRSGKRPCLYVACRYHLYLDVNPRTGSIKINFPDLEIHDLDETCALDVAERGGVTLEEVGAIMNLTRERIRQVEATGLEKLRDGEDELDTFLGD